VPDHPAADAPVLSLAHGTIGLADCAAPSKDHESHEPEIAFFSGLAKEGLPTAQFKHGAIVVATDYEGLGTPGGHPYVVGRSEGADVLDAIRAARRLTGTKGKAVAIGHSQGGGAALWAAQLAPTYAPDVDLVGVVAAAPGMELKRVTPMLTSGDNFNYLFLATGGFAAGYPEIDPADYLTPTGLEVLHKLETTCDPDYGGVAGKPLRDYFKADIWATEPFAHLLEQNSPGDIATDVPILVVHGTADEVLPVEITQWFLERTCRTGGFTIDLKTYPGADHHGVLVDAFGDITTFVADRLAGKAPTTTPCPKG
jgi:pimeloyl-ACP methyl ester carboxylesterase